MILRLFCLSASGLSSYQDRGRRRSCTLARDPHLLRRPPPRPISRDKGIAGGGPLGWAQLDEVFYLEAVSAQESYAIPKAQMELDRLVAGPLEAVHAEVVPQELCRGRLI